MTDLQFTAVSNYAADVDMPDGVFTVLMKLAKKDFTNLNRWIIAGQWRADIIRILKECHLYDEQVEGAILSMMDEAEASL